MSDNKDKDGGGSWFRNLSLAAASATATFGLAVYRWGIHKTKKIEGMEKEIQTHGNYIQCSQLQVLEGLLVQRQQILCGSFKVKEQLEEKIMKETIPLNIPGIQKDVEQIIQNDHDCNCHWTRRDKSCDGKLMWEKLENWKKIVKCTEYEEFKKVLQDHNE